MVATESSQLLLKKIQRENIKENVPYTQKSWKNTTINFSFSLLFMKTNQARSLVEK